MHQPLEWTAVLPRPTKTQLYVKASLIAVPFCLVVLALAFLLTFNKSINNALFITICIVVIANAGVFVTSFVSIKSAQSHRYLSYKLDDTHLESDTQKVPLSTLNRPAVSSLIKSQEIPYEQWDTAKLPDGIPLLFLDIPTSQGNVHLGFSQEYHHQQLLRSLKDYIAS